MPTYEYSCPLCKASKSVVKSIHDNNEETCENCHVALVKAFSAPPVSFKGGGWASKD